MNNDFINITEKVLQAIETVQQRKRDARRIPDHALVIGDRLFQMVSQFLNPEGFRKVLQRLTDEGKIVTGNTFNDTYVRIVKEGKVNVTTSVRPKAKK